MGGLTLGALAAAVVLAGCRERAQAVQSESEFRRVVRQMMPAVERATGLEFRRDPIVERRSRDQVRDYVMHKFDEDLPPAEMAGVQAAYRLFGLLPDTLDLRRTMIELFTEQVAGYYDPDSNALYVPADIDPFQVRLVVAHELVHALQDQYLDLDSIMSQKRENDRRTAAQSVLEGQATLAQILVLMPEQRVESLPNFLHMKEVLRAQQSTMPAYTRAPFWLREIIVFPYLGGAEFVRWFARTHPGRQPFGTRMPVSTEQILHPERFRAGDAPTTLRFPGGTGGPGAEPVRYEDVLGELETRLLLAQQLGDESEAALLAAGWDGDRYRVLGDDPEESTLLWYSVWDSGEAADRFVRALQRVWEQRRRTGSRPEGRRWRVERLELDGRPGVRLIDAQDDWTGWENVPLARVRREP